MRGWMLAALAVAVAGCDGGTGSDPSHPGEQIYTRYCFSWHAAGVAGAPRTGDAEAWAPRIDKGREALIEASIEGIPPGMPPRGLCTECTEEEIGAAVDYIIERSQ